MRHSIGPAGRGKPGLRARGGFGGAQDQGEERAQDEKRNHPRQMKQRRVGEEWFQDPESIASSFLPSSGGTEKAVLVQRFLLSKLVEDSRSKIAVLSLFGKSD